MEASTIKQPAASGVASGKPEAAIRQTPHERLSAIGLRPVGRASEFADQIHGLGLAQVAAIRQEMEAIKREVGFDGTLEQFFDHIRTDPQFKYPNSEAGREAYLHDARAVIAAAIGVSTMSAHAAAA